MISIVESMLDPTWFGEFFPEPETWTNWMAFLDALQGQELTPCEFEAYRRFTGRSKAPEEAFRQAFVISGRRSGKSRIASIVSVYLCLLSGLHKELSPGETGWVVLISSKKEQSQTVFNYVKALAAHFPKEIKRELSDEIHFQNGTAIKVTAGSFRGVRGSTLLGAVVDELAFLRSDEESRFVSNPAEEILKAIRPSIVKDGLMLHISTVYAARGPLYAAWKKHYGKDSKTLVWLATTPDMNPSFSPEIIADEMEEDRENALAEYYSQWREDLQTLIATSLCQACMTREEMPPQLGVRYWAFADLSGNRSDSHAFAVCHKEADRVVLDTMMEIEAKEVSVDNVVKQFSDLAKAYGVREISADAFGAEWAASPFERAGTPLNKSVMPKSNLFLNAAALIKSGKVDLIYSDRLLNQFSNLDRRPGPAGVDQVQKVPGSRDDLCKAVCGCLVTAHMEQVRMPALPVKSEHRADAVLTPSMVAGRKREEIRRSAEDEMRAFVTGSDGPGGRILRR